MDRRTGSFRCRRIEQENERHREREMRGSLDLGRKDAERRRVELIQREADAEDLDDLRPRSGQDAERGLLVVLRENLVDIDGLRFFPGLFLFFAHCNTS